MSRSSFGAIPAGAMVATGLALWTGALPIRYVPRVVDAHFTSRMLLCPGAPSRGGVGQANDSQKTVAEFLGAELREIAVHQIGDSFPEFAVVQQHIQQVMAQRPQVFSRYSPWAEATPVIGQWSTRDTALHARAEWPIGDLGIASLLSRRGWPRVVGTGGSSRRLESLLE